MASGSSRVIKSKPTKAKAKKEKKYKIPEFDEPKVVEDDFEDDEDNWLFDPPPPGKDHKSYLKMYKKYISY